MENIYRWNRWYDGLPDTWRFQTILGPLILIGLINMLLTVADGFPFGLLLLLGIAAVLCMRVPYLAGWLTATEAGPDGRPGAAMELRGADWMHGVNDWYEHLPWARRFLVIPVFLAVVGGINMWLTIDHAFPFGLLFLLGIFAVLIVRWPFVAGWVKPPVAAAMPQPALVHHPRLIASQDETAAMMHDEPPHTPPSAAADQPD